MRVNRRKSPCSLVDAGHWDRRRLVWILTDGILSLVAGFILLEALGIIGGSTRLHVPPDRPDLFPFVGGRHGWSVSMITSVPPIANISSFVIYALLFFATCIGLLVGYIRSKRLLVKTGELSGQNRWNWAAFFLTWLWYLWQGIWKKGLGLLAALLLVNILPGILEWRIEDYLTGSIPLEPGGPAEAFEQIVLRMDQRLLDLANLGIILLRLKMSLYHFPVLGILYITIYCGRNAEMDSYRR